MPSDRLTPLDASFLHLEDATGPMHVGCVMVLSGDPPPYEDFVSRVEERLGLVPRYRQRLAFVPLAQGRPRWVDDGEFDLLYHVRSTSLPAPGEDRELRTLAGRLFSPVMRRDKPLWELWLVDGLGPAASGGPGRFAVVSKTHHALVDGVSGLDILSALFAPEEEASAADGWKARRPPSGVELLGEALLERALSPAELVRPLRAALRRPRRLVEEVGAALGGVGALARAGLRPAPSTPYNRTVGPARRVAFVSLELEDVKAIRNALGGTVNDVVLTVAARALRRDLLRRGADLDVLQAFVPVSLREGTGRAAPGNEVTGMVVGLPIECPEPDACLQRISEETRQVKDSGQAMGAQALASLGGLAPPTLLGLGARLGARQRMVNLVITNVPGPQHALFLDGRELLEILPMVPVGHNLAMTVAIVSYNGTMSFGVVGDRDALPDLDVIVEDLRAAAEELAAAAGVELREPAEGGSAAPEAPAATEAEAEPEPTLDGAAPIDERDLSANGAAPLAEAEPDPDGVASGDEPEPDPDGGASRDAPAPVIDPQPHVDPDEELVAEFADSGAEEGAGAELRVDEPWPGYRRMTAKEITDRLAAVSAEEVAVVRLYESTHRKRRDVLRATDRALLR